MVQAIAKPRRSPKQMQAPSVLHPKSWVILRSRCPAIIEPRRGHIRVSQPFLHFRDVGVVLQRVRRRRRPQRVHAKPVHLDGKARFAPVVANDVAVHRIRIERARGLTAS